VGERERKKKSQAFDALEYIYREDGQVKIDGDQQ